ncbi:methionine--tRNA ligase [Candidatus Gracilibacteria bacterium]|nr:methionine--tRNA ligase [Candidatus Gracilibacteria bacterium]
MKKYFTTPIYYVNDIPHIGHAYCTLATDTLVRYWRKKVGKENVFFLTGTDENSQKTVDAAKLAQKPIDQYLNEMAKNWRTTWEQIGIEFDDFVRTTEKRHVKKVQEIFQKIYKKGDIYKGKYTGLYCTGCETFLKESDLDLNGHCPQHKKPPQKIEEENYFFRLSHYGDRLLEIYEKNRGFLQPESRRNEIVSFIKSGLEDISISRETSEFGITLPIDGKHKVYVWFDALINYLSGLPQGEKNEFWDHSCHIIGKDITRFHCVIWPAMLLSAEISPVTEVFAHGFFTIDGQKMSKSLGNVVSPLTLSEKYGNDALRIGLLSSFEFGNDGDFSAANFDNFYRSRLAGGVGNLFNRVIVLVNKFLEGKKPKKLSIENDELRNFEQLFEEKKIKSAIDYFFSVVDSANELLNKEEPWKLAKVDIEAAKNVFAILLQKLEFLTQMAEILLPETYPEMRIMLGDEECTGEAHILFQKTDE